MQTRVVFALLAVGLTGCGAVPTAGTSEQPVAPVELRATVGADVTIRLPSNPTTGYSWQMAAPPPEFLELLSTEYVPNAGGVNRLGAGGMQVFTFRAKAAGQAELVFHYVRPWEKDRPPANTQTFSIIVK